MPQSLLPCHRCIVHHVFKFQVFIQDTTQVLVEAHHWKLHHPPCTVLTPPLTLLSDVHNTRARLLNLNPPILTPLYRTKRYTYVWFAKSVNDPLQTNLTNDSATLRTGLFSLDSYSLEGYVLYHIPSMV